MIRPDVRVVQSQQEEIRDAQIDSWEAEQLLRKYGYSQQETSSPKPTNRHMTFEEMVAQEEARLAAERGIRKTTPSIDREGYRTETRYSTDEDSGYSFNVQVRTDMDIPKY